MRKNRILNLTIWLLFLSSLAFGQAGQETSKTEEAAKTFIKKGDMMMKAKQFDKAILEYDYALAISDTFHRAYFSKGMAYFSMKKLEDAVTNLEKTVSLKPDMMQAYGALMKCYSVAKKEDEIIGVMKRMAENESDPKKKIESYSRLSQFYIKKQLYNDAKGYAAEALKIDKTDIDALYNNAVVANALGDYQTAINNMESATSTVNSSDPKVTAKLYYELGYAYHKMKNFEKSDAALEKADFGPFKSQIAKLRPSYYFNIANSYTMVHDFENATKMLGEALAIDPKMSSANQLLADISVKTDNFPQKAVELYKKAIDGEEDTKQQVALYDKAIELLLNAKKYEEVVKISDECLSKVSNARNILFMKSISLYKLGKNDQAIAIVEQLLKDANLSPIETVKYNFMAGVVYVNIDNFDKAKEAFMKSGKGPFAQVAQHEMELAQTKMLKAKAE